MEGTPIENPRQAIEELAKAMQIPPGTKEVGAVSETDSETLRDAKDLPTNKPPHRPYRNLKERYPGAEGFAKRFPNDD